MKSMISFSIKNTNSFRKSFVLLNCGTKASFRFTSTVTIPQNDLFGLNASIYKDKDLIRRTEQAIQRINTLRQILRQEKNQLPPHSKLECLDNISNELCSIMDAVELCRHVHVKSNYREHAEISFQQLAKFVVDLNSDDLLYGVLDEMLNNPEELAKLSTEDQMFAKDLYNDFKNEGIHLPPEKRTIMKSLQEEISKQESLWNQNINSINSMFLSIGPISNDNQQFHQLSNWLNKMLPQQQAAQRYHQILSSIPTTNLDPMIKNNLEDAKNKTKDKNANLLYSTFHRRILSPLQHSIDEESVRKSLWYENYLQPLANIQQMNAIITNRQKLSNLLGFPTYIDRILLKNVTKKSSLVKELLLSLSQTTKLKTEQELLIVKQMKFQDLSDSSSSSSSFLKGLFGSSTPKSTSAVPSSLDQVTLSPWDMGYYQNMAAQSTESRENAIFRIKSYLSIANCIEGLQQLSKSLFQIEMREMSIDDSETWLSPEQKNELKKFQLFDLKTQKSLGIVYFDFFQRENKFSGSAHFTVKCSCDSLLWSKESNQPLRQTTDPNNTISSIQSSIFQTQHQEPIVVLVFHFLKQQNTNENQTFTDQKGMFYSGSSSSSSPTLHKTTLLSLQDVETLFHEWGHALHSLLSQTKYQHLSGTRGGTDYIEIPSHLFEYFARDSRVLQSFAKHYMTGEQVPLGMLEEALDRKEDFAGIDIQNQILLSIIDQYLFSEENTRLLQEHDSETAFLKSLDRIVNIQQQYTLLPTAQVSLLQNNVHDYYHTGTFALKQRINQDLQQLPGLSMLNHSHLINYGGSYYCYLLAKMYAAQVWYRVFDKDPFSPEAGEILRHRMLGYGSSKLSQDILSDIAGPELDPSYFLKKF